MADTDWLSWTYSGVDFALEGNGGEACAEFVPPRRKIIETILGISVGLIEIYAAFPRLTIIEPKVSHGGRSARSDWLGKRLMLAVLCLTFGVELGFKFATRQVIWLLNPCHVLTVLQIILLLAPPSRPACAIFRVQIHLLSGATLSLLFPVTNTMLLPFETEIYYLQHSLLLVVPLYLLSINNVYRVEPLRDFSWALFTVGLMMLYHIIVLQGISILTMVNLNVILCPGVSDPFSGTDYRVYTAASLNAMFLLHGKLYTLGATWLVRKVATPVAAELNDK